MGSPVPTSLPYFSLTHRSAGPGRGEALPAPSLGPVPMFMTVYFGASRKEKLKP